MRCLSCGAYTAKGKKFYNAPKHISPDTYLGIKIITLHCKCPTCSAKIIETDPKNMDYRIMSWAKRGFEAWRNEERARDTKEQRLDRFERGGDADDGGEATTAMGSLEHKLYEAGVEMAASDALDEIRAATARREHNGKGSVESLTASRQIHAGAEGDQDAEDARAAFKGKKRVLEEVKEVKEVNSNVDFAAVRPRKKKVKDFGKAFGIKRETKP